MDFGDFGSDEITLPIFCLDNDPLDIEIWEGTPEDGTLIDTVVYQKDCIWNTYQPQTFRLSRRLRGVTSISLRLGRKTHVAGFVFTEQSKAFSRLSVLENDTVSGDSFTVTDHAIERIGNNVSINFGGMDFGEEGATAIRIYGRTPNDKNTIQIRFEGENGQELRLVEFPHSEEYTEQTFAIDRLTGAGKVMFIFLPGCNFDFEWFGFVK